MTKTIKYKNFIITRQDNILYLGNFYDQYIIMMQILDRKFEKNNKIYISTKISVQLHDNNNNNNPIIKKTEKTSLFDAIDIGYIWITRANEKKLFLRS